MMIPFNRSARKTALVPYGGQSMLRRDMDFLPAAIEILETPPCPARTSFLVTICAISATTLLWTYLGQVDVVATARGKIQPIGRVQVVEPVETGRVARIFVKNGQFLKQGDPVLELDDADARADEAGATAALDAYRAEAMRRKAVLAAIGRDHFAAQPIAWLDSISAGARVRQARILEGDLGQLSATVASIEAQAAQKQAEHRRYDQTIVAQQTLIDILQQRVDMRVLLQSTGAGSKSNVIDAEENLHLQMANLTMSRGQLQEAIAGEAVLMSDRAKAIDTFKADNTQKLAEAEHGAEEAEQKLQKARIRMEHMRLTSPVAGRVTGLAVSSPGQVITTGEEVARVVPENATLEIEAYLDNKDIGFVKVGQNAIVKIDSFPYTRFGTINATVAGIANDAIPEPSAQQIEGDPAHAIRTSGLAGGQRTQNLVFAVDLVLPTDKITVNGGTIPLSPGMAVDVEIKTDRRRIIDYLFSPIAGTAASAFHER